MAKQIRGQGGHLVFPIGPKNTNLVKDLEILLPESFFQFSSAVSDEKSKMSQLIRDRAAILVFRSARKTQTW